MSNKGYLAIVLHAHLPFVRHPEYPRSLRRTLALRGHLRMLLPLLGAFERLRRGGVPFALTMSLTPPLAAMLSRRDVAQAVCRITSNEPKGSPNERPRASWVTRAFFRVAPYYVEHLLEVRQTWDSIHGDVVGAVAAHTPNAAPK